MLEILMHVLFAYACHMVEFTFVPIAIKHQLPVKFHFIVYLGLTLASRDTVKYANDKHSCQSVIKLPNTFIN